ncbi:MAG: hypothetical protein K8R76_04530 [Candidatus Aegiribacteria sp.]|nr:hypothetical protein [Candidatus Aegiribacteria sp.]
MNTLLLLALLVQTPVPVGSVQRSMAQVEPSPLSSLPADFHRSVSVSPDRGDSDVIIIIAEGLEIPLASELAQFESDLSAEGWNVTSWIMSGGSAADLRTFLQMHSDISGAVLVGNLPRAWYEMDEFTGQHEEFPMDLYLMDLDGIWLDIDENGLLDSLSGDRAPEIWVGRIDAHAMEFGSELSLLKDYFASNHLYRTGSLSVPARALAFNDDDWSYYGSCGLENIYSTVEVVNSNSQTTADNYKAELTEGYEFVHLMSHSSPWGHTFRVSSGYGGTVMAPEISCINPQTVFVQLFACSNCRWTEPNCLGNWYLFGTDYGLLAIGSTKTGAMLDFSEFYEPIGSGNIPGVAFRTWFTNVGIYNPDWHYGCVLLGDPTIMPLSGRDRLSSTFPVSDETDDYIQVSTSSFSDCYPVTASSGNNTWVAWLTAENGRLDIAARNWDGDVWSSVYYVDADEYWDVTPDMALDGNGEPWLAWSDFDVSTYGYNVKTASGSFFNNVTVAANGDGYDGAPQLAYTDRMWLVWQVWRRGEGDIMIKALDGSFPETYLSGINTGEISPTAAADISGYLHAAWVEGTTSGERIMWTRGSETGFLAPVEVSSGNFCRSPELVLVENTLLLLWQEDDDNSRIIAQFWNGTGWDDEEELFSSPTLQAFAPTAGLSLSGNIFAAWQIGNGTDAQIWQSTLEGAEWSSPSQLVNPAGEAWLPALSDGIIAWAGTGGDSSWNIYASLDGGVGISSEEELSVAFIFDILGNPVNQVVRLSVPALNPASAPFNVLIYDLTGRCVFRQELTTGPETVLTIPCTHLPPAVYCLRVSDSQNSWSSLFTIIR